MAWYDDLYSRPTIPDIIKTLNALGGEGTLRQIRDKIEEIYKLPKGMFKGERGLNLIKDPLDLLTEYGFVELRNKKYARTKKKFR